MAARYYLRDLPLKLETVAENVFVVEFFIIASCLYSVVYAPCFIDCMPVITLIVQNIGPSECGRDRTGFVWHSVSEKVRAIQYYRVLNIINLKLYNFL
jgi:hypothetical protein